MAKVTLNNPYFTNRTVKFLDTLVMFDAEGVADVENADIVGHLTQEWGGVVIDEKEPIVKEPEKEPTRVKKPLP